jgi:hypothetical protein
MLWTAADGHAVPSPLQVPDRPPQIILLHLQLGNHGPIPVQLDPLEASMRFSRRRRRRWWTSMGVSRWVS